MNSLDMIAMTDFKDEFLFKVQNVESEKLIKYCYSINETASESAKNVRDGMKTIFTKLIANVFEDDFYDPNNPLMVDLVIRNVLKYLPSKDLCSCRQVCSLWNQEANIYFRRKQRIVFYPESIDKMKTFIGFMKSEQTIESDNDFSKQIIPSFTSHCFTAQYPTTQFPKTLMQDFVNTCGQYIKKLEIFYPEDGYLSSQDFIAFFIKGMPHLESIHFVSLPLKLTQSSFLHKLEENKEIKHEEIKIKELRYLTHLRIDRTWQIETCWKKNFLRDLFKLMPNLQDYELWTWNSTTEDKHSEPYFVSLSSKQRETLKILSPGSIGDKLAITIADLGLKLHKLYLPVLNRNINSKTIEILLENQRNTLEELQLNCSTMQDSRFVIFPKMKKLRHLHMIITYPWNNDYTTFTPSIRYEDQFPSLQWLKLELAIYCDFGFINYFFPHNTNNKTICNSLNELDISFTGFRDEKFMGKLSEIFPNLKRLRLDGYGSKIFSSICLHLQNLESLELYLIYGFNVDDQITGIPKDICTRLRKSCAGKLRDSFKKMEDTIQVNPSLCSLTKLQKLVIRQKDYQAKFWPDAQCITNLSAYYVFSQMKHLRHLRIESVKFTEECCRYLAEAMEDCWLDFT